jgi:nitroreductase
VEYDNFLNLVKNRRSIRRFKTDPVPDEYIEKIIEAARWAPSGYNTQPWEFFIIKDKKLKDTIVQSFDLHNSLLSRAELFHCSPERLKILANPWRDEDMDFRAAPVFIILYADTRAKIGLPDMGKMDPAKTPLVIKNSLACAFVYMLLAATSMGLATQWLGGSPEIYSTLKSFLNIPEEFEPFAIMPVGYPAYKARPKLLRLKQKMVHYDYCGKTDFRTEQEVNAFARKTWIWTTANHWRGIDRT